MIVSTRQAEKILARTLEFRISDGHVEFLAFETDNDGREKITVRAVQPVELWAWQLWNQSLILVQQVMELTPEQDGPKLGIESFRGTMDK